MKRFADLNLRVPINDTSQTERMVKNAHELGYSLVGIPLPPFSRQEQISQLRNICYEVSIDFATRVNFSPRTSNELLHSLRRFRRKFEIISVLCHTKEVARQAAKDRRVDLLQFSTTNLRKRFFNEAEAELASHAFSSLEIEILPLLQLEGTSRIRLFSSLQKEAALAEKFKVPVTISSGATNEYHMNGPRDYAAFTTLFDMSQSSALKALLENPFAIVERNREKLSPEYVAPGIRVVGRRGVG
jgi:ribonuclease P/MRP protein subunit RPP1